MSVRTIVAATDFSEASEAAIAHAASLTTELRASLRLLHVVPDIDLREGAADLWGVDLDEIMTRRRADADERLRALTEGDDALAPGATCVLRVGTPSVEIIRYAREEAIDLIVIATRGKGMVEHLLLGSVAERLVRGASCPVLTVRDPMHGSTGAKTGH